MTVWHGVRYLVIIACIVLNCGALYAAGDRLIFTLPFSDPAVVITSGWLYDNAVNLHCDPEGNLCHRGIDFARPTRTDGTTSFDVRAAAPGRAIRTRTGTYGNVIYIAHDASDQNGRRLYTLYAHLEDDSSTVPFKLLEDVVRDIDRGTFDSWAEVTVVESIAKSGNSGTGGIAGIHLHFEIHRGGWRENRTDPYGIYNKRIYYPEPCAVNSTARVPVFDIGVDSLWTLCPPVHPEVETPPPTSPLGLQISTGNNQTGPAGAILPNAVSVLSVDQAGNTVGLIPVTFRVTSGGGCVSASPAGTNCQPELTMITNGTSGSLPGLAGVFWKLGPLVGAQTVEVSSPGLSTIKFSADATVSATSVYQYVTHVGTVVREGEPFNGDTCIGCFFSVGMYFQPVNQYNNVTSMHFMVSKEGTPTDGVVLKVFSAIQDATTGRLRRGDLIAVSDVKNSSLINQEPDWYNGCASFATNNADIAGDCFTATFAFATPISFNPGEKYLVMFERTGSYSPFSYYLLSGRTSLFFPTDPENAQVRCEASGNCEIRNFGAPVYTIWKTEP